MPLTITLDDAKVLEGITALQEVSVRLAAHRTSLIERLRGKPVSLQGGYRGTVLTVGSGKITLQDDKGVRREVALTAPRALQILDATSPRARHPPPAATTTRK